MKNNCDVSGKRTYCKTPEIVFGRCHREIECDYRDKTEDEFCTFRGNRGSCSNLAAIRAAIEAEKETEE